MPPARSPGPAWLRAARRRQRAGPAACGRDRPRRRDDGELTVGGVDVRDLARRAHTPAYVLDEADFRARARGVPRRASPAYDVFYAGKAFLCTAVARWIAEEGLSLDVCSGGELAVALRAGFDPARIGFHGNNKSDAELRRAVARRRRPDHRRLVRRDRPAGRDRGEPAPDAIVTRAA